MKTPEAFTSLLNEVTNGRLRDSTSCTVETPQRVRFYCNNKYDNSLSKHFYEVKKSATPQQGFKASYKCNAAKLINQAFQVRGYVPNKVEYRLNKLYNWGTPTQSNSHPYKYWLLPHQ